MLRTEEEAKKCWCPFARVPVFDTHDIGGAAGASANRSDMSASPGFAPCIASECMAWRWREDRLENVEEEAADKAVSEGWVKVRFQYVGPRGLQTPIFTLTRRTDRGFCGLAGSLS